ncbi:MAG TPA: SIMPL domain-containing protein [Polyangiaceae bacterium]
MNPKPIEEARDPLLAKALPALRRARERAEEIARATNTALVFVVDGEIVRHYPGRDPAPEDESPKDGGDPPR